jgi:hypothetical protein
MIKPVQLKPPLATAALRTAIANIEAGGARPSIEATQIVDACADGMNAVLADHLNPIERRLARLERKLGVNRDED